jgi:hypothetical protein
MTKQSGASDLPKACGTQRDREFLEGTRVRINIADQGD